MNFLRLIGSRARPYTGALIAILVLQTISTLATLYLPSLNARIIDEGVSRGDVDLIWNLGAIMLGVAFLQVISACIAVWFGARTSMGTGRDIRSDVFRQVSRFSAEDIGHFGSATLITRGTNDVQQVQMTYMMMLNFVAPAPIMMVGGIIMAVREDPGMSWLVVVSVIVLFAAVSLLIARLMPLFTGQQKKIDAINGVLREQITGIRVVRAFTREDHEEARFAKANAELTDLSVRIGNLFVLLFPIIMLILNLATGAVMWFGGQRVDAGAVEVGSLTAFLQYLMQILTAVMMGAFMAMMLPRALVCSNRITEVLEREPAIVEPANPVVPERKEGVVEFKNVSFSYPGAEAPVLHNLSFEARPGQVTAIIGSTGAGKTTLLGLIPRLYTATQGQVLLDGAEVASMAREGIVERVSMVPQKPYLFSGTVRSNLAMANPEASEEEMWAALRTAQADFVDDLDMPISQGGTNVSGGQRQRLSIARMLVAPAKVYLFDDSFSALDMTTDARLRAALTPRMADSTMIVVAQRVSSIMEADQILVMEAGEIIARGTHAELLETSEAYRDIVHSQASDSQASEEVR
ncbi:ABC transporter ATP-binding protein [Corynebacterium lowii]|uniref:Putative ABC transporter ATP-binding protein n=1 Tax=Corynebacterium lowii TaxID=1544413 RepID=A0A0Q0U608_9CORY|nr:ABC transporter ATP-binding protein [Corynebacterium lowii]KQB87527.1 putative ABC transporter ATP-binding protein [Corynebacterium lowii]MDP9851878.1 ATP-binding cassette subfamily B protein [Corynebacterium lowii]